MSLDRARVAGAATAHYYVPAFEPAVAHITGRLVANDGALAIESMDLRVVCAAQDFGEIRLIRAARHDAKLHSLLPAAGSAAGSAFLKGTSAENNNACDPSLMANKRRLIVQPVGFKTTASDPSPSGSTTAAQLGTAQTVWSKACIEFEIRPITYIEDAALKTSSDLTAIRAAYTDGDPNVIEIFFVQNSLPGIGGGSAGAIGVASCKIVAAEPNAGDHVLLAHELGHVLGLLHPGSGSNSDAGTVMAPTGSATVDGTEFVTHFMTTNIANPVLQTLPDTCCLSHDTGNHYVRDFPVDIGNEPSDPLPAGMTRYAMSNVWNRLTDTIGSYSATTGPEHEGPARFLSDGVTPRTNYLFAKVEQLQNLKVRDAHVKFYLKHPGSGSGGVNLQLLGQVAVPDALAVGVPQTVRIPWTVPAGAPSHSCVFAVVTSPAEPEGDQTGRNWSQFEALAHEDNDWAQRNLDIVNTSNASNSGDSNTVQSAPWILRVPPLDGYDALPVELVIDGRGAKGLSALAVEIPGHERISVPPGERITVMPQTRLIPGQDMIFVIQAVIPGSAPRGASFTVAIEPSVAEQPLVGFATKFRIGGPRAVIAQVLDRWMAALTDLADAMDDAGLHRLLAWARSVVAAEPHTLDELAERALTVLGRLDDDTAAIRGSRVARDYDMDGVFARLREAAKRYGSQRDALPVVEALRDFAQRTQLVAAYLFEHPGAHLPRTVRVIVDRLEILYDHDLVGPGECYFIAEVEDAHGVQRTRRFPLDGYYRINAGCRRADVQLAAVVYDGAPGAGLRLSLDGREIDPCGKDRFTHYERAWSGEPSSFVGTYAPGTSDARGEGMPDWRVFYRIV